MNYKEIIDQQIQSKERTNWEGTVIEYLEKVKEDPRIAATAPNRVYNMIMNYGIEEVDDSLKIPGYDDLVKYKFFENKVYGNYYGLHDLMKFLHAASMRTETGRRILMMIGPVSSGKSLCSAIIKKGLEMDQVPKYAIKGCPIHEEPLNAIPVEDREYWDKELGTKIAGSLCPVCQYNIDQNYTDEKGRVRWSEIPVEQITFSESRRCGIGTFSPTDPKEQDVTELIGRVNMSKLAMYSETDPRAFEFSGELHIANRGIIEYIEVLKASIKFHYILIPLAQEQLIKSPGFPQMYIDTLVLSHSNQTEFDSFKAEKKNEALHDRIYPVYIPYNLRVKDEVEIYKKMIRESDFNDIHISPNALEVAAQFAVITRLVKSSKVSNLIQKMKIYNGEVTDEFKKEEIDVKSLRKEGKVKGEGMSGISPRFIINALNVAMGSKIDKKCINAIDVIKYLKGNFDHQIGISEEDTEHYTNLLTADKDSVTAEFKEFAKKEVNLSFVNAYKDQAQALFERYMKNVSAYVKKEQIYNDIEGEYNKPDEKIMRAIEELIPVPENSKDEFRKGVFVYKADCLEKGKEFKYNSYDPLRTAIEKKLMGDLKNFVSLSLADSTNTNPKAQKRRDDAMQILIDKGYCKHCASALLSFVGEILRRES